MNKITVFEDDYEKIEELEVKFDVLDYTIIRAMLEAIEYNHIDLEEYL